mgnify:FL=1
MIQKAIDSSPSAQNDSDTAQNDNSASAQNDSQVIALPAAKGLCYVGKGISFEVDGQVLPMTEANRFALERAVKSGKDISWTWSRILSLKQGGSATPTFEVRYLDTKARVIPDLQLLF